MNLKKQTTTAGESVTIVVEVVRCKDCKHYKKDRPFYHREDNTLSYAHGEADFSDLVHVVRCGQCKFFQSSGCFVGVQGAQVSSDNYCAWGQRKDG